MSFVSEFETFENHESVVRCYCHDFNDLFLKAKDSFMYSASGKRYIDFFSAAGSLNYGHNNDFIVRKLIEHIQANYIIQSLDMYTVVKRDFINYFQEYILHPRGLKYKLQFCGPTGTNAVEAALKLARKFTGRRGIIAFSGSFHGMSSGSLSISSNSKLRQSTPLSDVCFVPYPNPHVSEDESIRYLEHILTDPYSGYAKPAAIILETVQAEGGINIPSAAWLWKVRSLCDEHGLVMIVDDIQVGCGRTGNFFSFERANLAPDLVVISKSISGYGGPMSLLLIKEELDVWEPGEHTGTFRGYQLAYVGGLAALQYLKQFYILDAVKEKEKLIGDFLNAEIAERVEGLSVRGIGCIWGIDFSNLPVESMPLTKNIVRSCFQEGLIFETAGRKSSVIKLLPALNTPKEVLEEGLEILKRGILQAINSHERLTAAIR